MTRLAIYLILMFAAPILGASEITAWERYLDRPTSENAQAVRNISYTEKSETRERLYDDLALLAVQIVSSNHESVRLAYRLRSRADGHLAETIDVMLGRLIRVNPHLFLTVLEEYRSTIVRLDSLVGNFGMVFLDREGAHRYEARRRRDSLLTVGDVKLVAVRDECVALLIDDEK